MASIGISDFVTAAVYILGENPSEEVDDDENDNYYQRLMLHPYITSSRTIINIVLSYVELGWTLRGL